MFFKRNIDEVKRKLHSNIRRLENNSEVQKLKSLDLKEEFMDRLIALNMIKNEDEKQRAIESLKFLALKIPELKGWPEDKVKFWDMEATRWGLQISSDVREAIKQEILKRIAKNGYSLEIGCGACPVIDGSGATAMDVSEEMLSYIDKEKYGFVICADAENKIPFGNKSFDSVLMVFVVNYLKNLENVLSEIKRVLKKDGKIIIIQSDFIDRWYEIQEAKSYLANELKKIISKAGFAVKIGRISIGKKELVVLEAKAK